jgi:RHS repeat-associated protein
MHRLRASILVATLLTLLGGLTPLSAAEEFTDHRIMLKWDLRMVDATYGAISCEADPGALGGTLAVDQLGAADSGVLTVVLGKPFSVEINTNYATAELTFRVPDNYAILINGIQQARRWVLGDPDGEDEQDTIEILVYRLAAPQYPAATDMLWMDGNLNWTVGLGNAQTAGYAGSLGLIMVNLDKIDASVFARGILNYTSPDPDNARIERYPATGALQQVKSEALLINAVDITDGFELCFYEKGQFTLTSQGSAATINGGQDPFRVLQFMKGTANNIAMIRRHDGGNLRQVDRISFDDNSTASDKWDDTWVSERGHEPGGQFTALQRKVVQRSVSGSDMIETITVRQDANSPVVAKTRKVYQTLGSGQNTFDALMTVIEDPDGLAYTTTYTYYTGTDAADPLRGLIKSIVDPHGGWKRFEYYDEDHGANGKFKGRVHKIFEPFDSTPASPAASESDPSLGKVTTFQYKSVEYPSSTRSPADILVFYESTNTGNGRGSAFATNTQLNGKAVLTETVTHSTAGLSYTEVHKRYRSYLPNNPRLQDLPVASTHVDGTQVSWHYSFGNFTGDDDDPTDSVFAHDANGSFVRVARFNGMEESAGSGTLISSVPTSGALNLFTTLGNAIVPLKLLANRSTVNVSIRDFEGNTVYAETWVYTGSGYARIGWNYARFLPGGRPTLTKAHNGQEESFAYNALGQLNEHVAWDGRKTTYAYDAIGRVQEETQAGISGFSDGYGSFQTQADLVTTHTRDAADRTIARVVSSAGGAETLTARWQFDLGGRLVLELQPCGSGYVYAWEKPGDHYDVWNRQRASISWHAGNQTLQVDGLTGMTLTREYHLDGSVAVESGTEVVTTTRSKAVSYGDFVTETGVNLQEARVRVQTTTGASRWVREYYDAFSRLVAVETRSPEDNLDDAESNVLRITYAGSGYIPKGARGKPVRRTQPGSAPYVWEYDGFGELIREGLDVNDDSLPLAPGTMDVIIDHERRIVQRGSDWWLLAQQLTFPVDNNGSTQLILNRGETRLTGFASGTIAESVHWERVPVPSPAYGALSGSLPSVRSHTEVNPAANRRTVDVVSDHSALSGSVNRLQRSVNGRPVLDRQPGPVSHRTEYDALGRVSKEIGQRGVAREYGYIADSTMVEKILDPEKSVWRNYEYAHCGTGLPTREWYTHTPPGGSATTVNKYFEYNTRGQLLYAWGNGQQPLRYDYDATTGERTHLHTYRGGTWTGSTRPGDFATGDDVTEWVYDTPTGVLITKIDAKLEETGFEYDRLGRVRKIHSPRGITTTQTYAATTGLVTARSYSPSTDTANLSFSYDRLGRPTSITDKTGTRTFSYQGVNDNSPLSLAQETLPSGHYGTNNRMVRQYDGQWRQNTLKLGSSGTPAAVLQTDYTFAAATGFLEQIRATFPNGGGSLESDVRYSYHENARLVAWRRHHKTPATQPHFLTHYAYDSQNRLSEVRNNWSANEFWEDDDYLIEDAISRHQPSYDQLGRVYSLRRFGDLYDIYNNATAGIRTEYGYTARGEMNSSLSYAHNNNDALLDRVRVFAFDPAGNRSHVAHRWDAGSSDWAWDDYAHNELNQMTREPLADESYLRGFTSGTGTEWVYDYEQDDYYWTRRPGAGKYFYIPYPTWDAAQENDPDITRWFYRYWDSTWMSQYFVGQPREPAYDAAGNMTYEGTGGNPSSNLALNYDYDAENRLIRVYNAYWRVNFAYDYMSRMVRQYTEINEDDYWSLEIDWRFVYDGNRMIARYLADGGISPYESLVWGLDISQSAEGAGGIGGLAVLFRHGANKRYVPGYDERGNVILLYGVDESTYGYVVSEYEYSDHGELLRATGWTGPSTRVGYDPVYNSFRWQTKWWLHAAAGTDNGKVFDLYNFGYRWYHPGHGRFINRDPIGEAGGINLYAYVGNDPVNKNDWMGLCNFNHPKNRQNISNSKPGLCNDGDDDDEWDSELLDEMGGIDDLIYWAPRTNWNYNVLPIISTNIITDLNQPIELTIQPPPQPAPEPGKIQFQYTPPLQPTTLTDGSTTPYSTYEYDVTPSWRGVYVYGFSGGQYGPIDGWMGGLYRFDSLTPDHPLTDGNPPIDYYRSIWLYTDDASFPDEVILDIQKFPSPVQITEGGDKVITKELINVLKP